MDGAEADDGHIPASSAGTLSSSVDACGSERAREQLIGIQGQAPGCPLPPLLLLLLLVTPCAGGGGTPRLPAPTAPRCISRLPPPPEPIAPCCFPSPAAQMSPTHPRALPAPLVEPRLAGCSWQGWIWGPKGSIICTMPMSPCSPQARVQQGMGEDG